jgi:alanyl-tRNA synthetase
MAAMLNSPVQALPDRVTRLQEALKAAEQEIDQLARKLARTDFRALLDDVREVAGLQLLAARVDAPDAATLREMADWFRDRVKNGVIVLGTVVDDKPLLIAATTKQVVESRGVHAGNLVRELAKRVGGGGGGRPDMAQAGGRDADQLNEALASVQQLLRKQLSE